jgi:hypothetical protein
MRKLPLRGGEGLWGEAHVRQAEPTPLQTTQAA